jgi:hypothetical protein
LHPAPPPLSPGESFPPKPPGSQPPPIPVFDPAARRAQQKTAEAADTEQKNSSVFLPKWVWRVWGVLLLIRFLLWLGDSHNTTLGFGKLFSLPFVTFLIPSVAAGWVLQKNPENRDKAALAFLGTYLFLWVLAW